MGVSSGPIDEDARRCFERARQGYSSVHLADFLPEREDPRYAATLEELICIELEFAWKDWSPSRPTPELGPWLERFPELQDTPAAARLEEEAELLRRTHFHEPPAAASAGRYEFLEEIGRGTFARVFRARDPRLERHVAVKVLRAEYLADERMRERFQREAQSAAHLHHPGIVQVFEVGEQDGRPFIASELIEGPTLEERLEAGPLSARATADHLARLCDALDYAHRCGIVHRDVKPENVLTTEGGALLISDFGLALQQEAESGLTRHGDLLGTPAYMSPEQARGDRSIDARSDIYSLGVVLYRALCGELPFEGSWSSILRRVADEEPVPPRRRHGGIPADLETICLTAMAKEPERRYSTAAAMAADLRRFLALEPIQARRPTAWQSLRLWCRRNPALAATVGVAALLVTGISWISVREIVQQRDEAYASEYDALVDGARAMLEARTTDWWQDGLGNLKKARALDSPRVDVDALRELATEFFATASPSFHERARWGQSKSAVTAVAIDRHGELAAYGRESGELELRSVPGGRELSRTQPESRVSGLAFHFGRALLVHSAEEEVVRTFHLAERASPSWSPELEPAFERSFGARVRALACSPVDPRTVLAFEDGRILLFDDWTPDSPALAMKTGSAAATDLRFSPDGRYFISCHEKGDVVVWDAEGRGALDLYSVGEAVKSVAIDAEGRALVGIPTWYGFMRRNPWTGQIDRIVQREAHEGNTTAVRLGGEWIFSAARDGSLKAWNESLRERATVTDAHNSVLVLDVDPRGRFLVAGHADGSLVLWEFSEPAERVFIRSSTDLAFRRGRRLVCYGQESNFENGLESGLHDVRSFRPAPLTTLAPVGERGALACGFGRQLTRGPCSIGEGEICLVDPDGGVRRWTAYDQHGLFALSADPSGERLASVSTGGELKVWDLGELRATNAIDLGLSSPSLLSWSEDGRELLIGGSSELLRVSLEGGESTTERLPWSGPTARLGEWVAVGDKRGVIEIHDPRTGERLAELDGFDEPVTTLLWHGPANTLIAGAGGGEIRSWRAPSWEPGMRWKIDNLTPVWLAVDRHSRYLAMGGQNGSGSVQTTLFEFASGKPLVWIWQHQMGCGAFSADGSELLLGSSTGAAVAVELEEVEAFLREEVEVGALELEPSARPFSQARTVLPGGHTWAVWGVAVSPDGQHVATCAHDGTVNLWTGEDCLELDWSVDGHRDVAWSVSFDPASERLASTSLDVKVWSVEDGRALFRLEGHDRLATCSVFLPAHPWLVTGALDGSIRVWELGEGVLLAEPRSGVSPPIHDLALDPGGRWLAAACGDGTVLLWEHLGDGDPSRGPDRVLDRGRGTAAAASPAWAVGFDPSGEHLAVADEDGGVCLWRTADWELLARLQCGTRRLRAVSFSGDGELLALGTYVHRSIVWDLGEVKRSLGELGLGW